MAARFARPGWRLARPTAFAGGGRAALRAGLGLAVAVALVGCSGSTATMPPPGVSGLPTSPAGSPEPATATPGASLDVGSLPAASASAAAGVSATPGATATAAQAATSTPKPTPAHGFFVATGSMKSGPEAFAVRLQDGRVLFVSGANCSPTGTCVALRTAELYNPSTGSFATTGSLDFNDIDIALTPLQDGRALLISSDESGMTRVYSPSTGTWSASGSMHSGRASTTATRLADGRVLVAGGWQVTGATAMTESELFNPSTNSFVVTGSMLTPRASATSALLADGRVLVLGGEGKGGAADLLTSAELYDPATGKFTATGSLHAGRMEASATTLPDGHIVVIGGVDSNADPVYTVEVYDPGTGVFTITDVMSTALPCTAALLPNGHILILGGNVPGSGPVLAYEYVPSMGKFLLTGNGTTPKVGHLLVTLANGRVLVAGGGNAFSAPLTAWLYVP